MNIVKFNIYILYIFNNLILNVMNESLNFNLIRSGEYQDKAIIMIHGWQGNKDSFKFVVNLLDVPNCAWYFPEAPYDFEDNPDKKTWAKEISPGVWTVEKPKRMLRKFIEDEVLSDFNSEDVFVLGFSQGAAVCYELICSFTHPLGGIFPVGGFMREIYKNTQLKSLDFKPAQFNRPILIGHGRDDNVVPLESSEKAYKLLKKYCENIDLYIYNGRHKIGIEYLKKVKELILSKYIKA